MVIDPIANLFTSIRNALKALHENVTVPHSKIKADICKILKQEGFISDFNILEVDKKKSIQINLKYKQTGLPAISIIKRYSKLGCRHYVPKSNIPKVLKGYGICVLSTSKGVLSGRDARKANVGGELIGIIH